VSIVSEKSFVFPEFANPRDDEDMVDLVMKSFPPSFDSFVESLCLIGETQTLALEKMSTFLL
jgi:hypothetical protein